MTLRTIRIGGASGFWGDASLATPQLLGGASLDYIVYDYLAEITMSILARARARDPSLGYATDFVSAVIQPHIHEFARRGIRIIANAGGVNPLACADAVRQIIRAAGLDLSVAVVLGDDLSERAEALAAVGIREMFSAEPFPPCESIASINAYLGAFPIAAALDRGADIVITGRCVDSAVTLGACIHEFGWSRTDYARLAAGSLAGHLIECGTQMSGGNFTDWESVQETLVDAGYPIVEISADGQFVCTKPTGTGGSVTVGTVAEQMLYEIGDPQAYQLPDVIGDFSEVELHAEGPDRVRVQHVHGRAPSGQYKVSATWADGFRGGEVWTIYGRAAERKARVLADMALTRARRVLAARGLPDFSETCVEIIGSECHYGAYRRRAEAREVDLKIAARHPSATGITILQKEFIGCALAAPPGLTGFAGGRPKPSPVVRLFSFMLDKQQVEIQVDVDGERVTSVEGGSRPAAAAPAPPARHAAPAQLTDVSALVDVPLESLAWARSGDKGNNANVGVIARHPAYLPYLWASLDEQAVAQCFAHFQPRQVERYLLPGLPAINFILRDVLGGGGIASLRNDPQGKGYAQLLLECPVRVPAALLAAPPARHPLFPSELTHHDFHDKEPIP